MLAILGPGAVGGLLGAALHRAGEDVVVVARPASARRILAEGIQVRSELFGEFTAMVPVTTALPAGSAVVLAVKAYGLPDVLPQLAAARPSEVLALLNGLGHAEALGEIPGARCGSVQVEAAREDGVVIHRGRFLIVNVPADADGRIAAALRRSGVDVRVRGTEQDVLWAKYSFLAPTALLTSWADLPLGEALARDPDVARGVVDEVAAVATADGHPTTSDELDALLRRLPATMMSSLQHDVRAGGPTELEAIGGHLIVLGERHGVPVPTLERVVDDLRSRLAA
ncbi:2-dehydropantoate 2-reductase [Georgenia soli]|uniref:2-dehydropantoate 2-reductase n=1 Tax=Georgenia soli TaxID=638953 RepID=A0A2A9EMS9_9MICO|nr:2-dehydropantoate 2-reductase [Georgenia soli]PFG40397.1 2-dehydropantoate 2-reductase [Georgenia soli]